LVSEGEGTNIFVALAAVFLYFASGTLCYLIVQKVLREGESA